MSAGWTLEDRSRALASAASHGVDLVVIGGGITGAGVLRDAASRGLRALLVERWDFASGTSSRSSKMLHGGLRYIGEGQLGTTYESCRERDRLMALNPNLVRPTPFLFPSYRGGSIAPWQLRVALFLYRTLALFRATSRYRIVPPAEVFDFCGDLRRSGLRAAGIYYDAQVDDARLVIESLKSARCLGGEAANHVEAIGIDHDRHGHIAGVEVRDRITGRSFRVATPAIVNAAGPSVERVRGLDRPVARAEMRPAKGVHLVIAADRIPARGTVTFEAGDGRHLFLAPWDDVALIGTTDTFSTEVDEPRVEPDEVEYLIAAANQAFPSAELTTADVLGVFAGVRPLVASPDRETPPSSVSREHRITDDPSGLVSVAGGKLTTYRSMGEQVVERAMRWMPEARRRAAGPSRTWNLPLREDRFDRDELSTLLRRRYGLDPTRAEHLLETWGADAERLLEEAPPEWREPIGESRHVLAEIPWSFRTECPATLCDLLERRLRVALFTRDQGLSALRAIVGVAGQALGWSAERRRSEAEAYAETVRRRYRLPAVSPETQQQSAA